MFSVFKTLTDQTVIVELKNDLCITGVLKSVDQYVLFGIVVTSPICDPNHFAPRYLNIRLDAIKVQNPDQHPHMVNSAAYTPRMCITYPLDLL
jgi:U6 snRNA-associated Sm-like protein LSm2